MDLNAYDYFLPKKNLALSPANPRDSSKLFVYNTKTDEIFFDRFYNLDKYLPKNSFLVLNNTKVLPARVEMKKESGGKVIVLFLVNTPSVMVRQAHHDKSVIPTKVEGSKRMTILAMVDRKINVGGKLFFDDKNFVEILSQKEHIFDLKFNFSRGKLFALLKKYGTMPVPLYLKKTPLNRDELMEKYQTIFAKKEGSSAAPTASLHFTDRVFDKLEKKGINKYFITLHVGLGTFAPLTDDNLKTKKLHEEYFEVDSNSLQCFKTLKSEGKKLVAVGTTVTRTLETLTNYSSSEVEKNSSRQTRTITGKTDLFIFSPYDFKIVDILITNFHLPKSSLMMLVEAFLQYKGAKKSLVELYNIAIKNNFRFYSFGDAMIIL
ncbi:tRNA preQ1(34) S-adenosylmethionine ribosyltransferase-isomerase QueA [Candidatus Roizmanbacteria bacterium CG_4_10_14_0_2_um_filter_36_35]|uniref:tRNA preQ1(34) S-adenosylmethionine ribosyltransferase-isomerase QueA n=3 Tax=Candidatus Roizmaniibacteriota TaxID=1752723 RepID=A0A2M7BVR0_9BACT|nr:MAG: tRNA preQ1(34) S-adenosylmethionine ribosyltransferase-isomerase QueA [Candidatus Roizmanbacteria bacterium CG11_big_fil_rev_8_21_14_0_20_35_14]PIV10650.1 MAG: tRNA preQ1(34) S-adenosylmethionine ribosyltransferase-isomerase QueA [Candidatus Roizmanbacteria bacterium CG03_land_8_20_14_0_80_35_26]PIZ67095.1 MAG: tRNA preQ1(34) S-adenosylmethionine ribosyltransferase-isomerase QueA [Candidatus Roizmanbacteria bacterium CG_4_10_14_0_2_um_filter_36_35]